MAAIEPIGGEAGRYRIDFGALGRGLFARMLGGPVEVDPYRLALALRAVVDKCQLKDAHGRRIVWNEFVFFLSSADLRRLKELQGQFASDVPAVLEESASKLGARTVGDWVVRLLADEASDLPTGHGEVQARCVDNGDLAAAQDDEMTVRVRPGRPVDAGTTRIDDANVATEGGVRLRWSGGEAFVSTEQRVQLGRPHANPPPGFVALEGADDRVNRVQLWVERSSDAVCVGRGADANPVVVAGRPLQAGGKIWLNELPAEVDLSRGALVLTIEPV